MKYSNDFTKNTKIKQHYICAGDKNGTAVVLIHGNCSSAVYWKPLIEEFLKINKNFYFIAPDLRGYGKTERAIVNATRGAADWADDLEELLEELQINEAHFIGWSLGGAVVMQMALHDYKFDRKRVKSMNFISSVSPFGFGGSYSVNGIPYAEFAGSGGGGVNREFVKLLEERDIGMLNNVSPKNVLNSLYFNPPFTAKELENEFLEGMFEQALGEEHYPGDFTVCATWPYFTPGNKGAINAISNKHLNVKELLNSTRIIPVAIVNGACDKIVADNISLFDFAYLGKIGVVPNYPGENIAPTQPMREQLEDFMKKYVKGDLSKFKKITFDEVAHSAHIEKSKDVMQFLLECWGA